jgi:Flp pilus assembly CpaE family ATPase
VSIAKGQKIPGKFCLKKNNYWMWVRRWEAELIESLEPHACACIAGTESSKIENVKAIVFLMIRNGPDSSTLPMLLGTKISASVEGRFVLHRVDLVLHTALMHTSDLEQKKE